VNFRTLPEALKIPGQIALDSLTRLQVEQYNGVDRFNSLIEKSSLIEGDSTFNEGKPVPGTFDLGLM
jgi:hypothetical protein